MTVTVKVTVSLLQKLLLLEATFQLAKSR